MGLTRRNIIQYGAGIAAAAALPVGFARGTLAAQVTPPANRTLTGAASMPGFTVPAGQIWEFDPAATTTVVVTGNVIVEGTLRMRPVNGAVVHTLRFVGVDETLFVGGHTTVPLATDVGLWVVGDGVLDAQGTPRAGWNRTGNDPTWTTGDEIVAAPNAPGVITTFAPFTKGGTVPTVTNGGVVYPTEIANLTRNVCIEGTAAGRAHIMFLLCRRPQTLRHLAIRWMGPTRPTGQTYRSGGIDHPIDASILGRYGLHFHHCGESTRPTVVEGVVTRDTGGPGFVAHLSNGVTFRDCIAFEVRDAGFWWDDNSESLDVVYEHCAAMVIRTSPPFRGYDTRGFLLNEGTGIVVRDCVAVGVLGNRVNAGGFHWPSTANFGRNVWVFQDNVAHNNRGPGLSTWQNDDNPHVVERFTSYNNTVGVSHGAYVNKYTYRDGVTFGNGSELEVHAIGATTFERVKFGGVSLIAKHSLPSADPTRFLNCTFAGLIKVNETTTGKAGVIRFESTAPEFDLTPAKFVVTTALSTITVLNSDGSTFTVRTP